MKFIIFAVVSVLMITGFLGILISINDSGPFSGTVINKTIEPARTESRTIPVAVGGILMSVPLTTHVPTKFKITLEDINGTKKDFHVTQEGYLNISLGDKITRN